MSAHSDSLVEEIRARASALGFDACQLASAEAPWSAGDHLDRFVEAGRHGDMDWIETTLDRRRHPQAMWDQARTAIVLGLNYGPGTDPLVELEDPSRGYISVYARGDDYHELIKGRLKTLAGFIAARTGEDGKVFVDPAPLMEKPLAQRAGLGWQGKHTNLLSRRHGNWLFLGVILSAADLPVDEAEGEHCGSCTACLDACDGLATMTSLTGFEALLRGKRVMTWGRPFYAGWGLTEDTLSFPRRTRRVDLDTLIAEALIRYPLYVTPDGYPCEAEDVARQLGQPGPLTDTGRTDGLQRWTRGLIASLDRSDPPAY